MSSNYKKQFIGRKSELETLQSQYETRKSRLVVVYGRRRVGKSAVIKKFGEDKNFFYFEGVENQSTSFQISFLFEQLKKQTKDPLLNSLNVKSWIPILDYISTQIIAKIKRPVICFDELPWLAVGRSKLVSLIKSYWDNHWKDSDAIIILCGSLTTFMVKQVVKSKALYGRINLEMNLKGFLPNESKLFFKNKISDKEILKYLLIFGGIPKYLEEINLSRSWEDNINAICFNKNSPMIEEVQKIFYSQFKEHRVYAEIVKSLLDKPKKAEDLARDVKEASGGGFKEYLTNLQLADFIKDRNSLNLPKRYKLLEVVDEFLSFHYKYVSPNIDLVKESNSKNLFERLCKNSIESWLGIQFERFCRKYALQIAKVARFEDKVLKFGTIYQMGSDGYQFDIAYLRTDQTLILGEIKFTNTKVTSKVAREFEERLNKINLKSLKNNNIKKMLISLEGPSDELRELGYFDYFVQASEMLKVEGS